jgi:hypothetical protein
MVQFSLAGKYNRFTLFAIRRLTKVRTFQKQILLFSFSPRNIFPLIFALKSKGTSLCVLIRGYLIGSAIKNLGLFSKSPGDLRIEKMDF